MNKHSWVSLRNLQSYHLGCWKTLKPSEVTTTREQGRPARTGGLSVTQGQRERCSLVIPSVMMSVILQQEDSIRMLS